MSADTAIRIAYLAGFLALAAAGALGYVLRRKRWAGIALGAFCFVVTFTALRLLTAAVPDV